MSFVAAHNLIPQKYLCANLGRNFCTLSDSFYAPKNQDEENLMDFCSTTSSVTVSDPNPAALENEGRDVLQKKGCARRRRISPEAGHALEILGHAIEYLGDEFADPAGSLNALNAQMEAVQLLMEINRQIYLQCPEVPSMGTRWRELLHLRPA